ncbi:MAG: hypothetical protein V4665_01550 [Patescibacteria group bacterium]
METPYDTSIGEVNLISVVYADVLLRKYAFSSIKEYWVNNRCMAFARNPFPAITSYLTNIKAIPQNPVDMVEGDRPAYFIDN